VELAQIFLSICLPRPRAEPFGAGHGIQLVQIAVGRGCGATAMGGVVRNVRLEIDVAPRWDHYQTASGDLAFITPPLDKVRLTESDVSPEIGLWDMVIRR
jgi:hypothetical protein